MPSRQVSQVQQDVRTAVVALHVWDCTTGLGTPIAWCEGQQKGDSPDHFWPQWVFQATCLHQVLSSASRAVPLEEQETLGKDDLLV